MAFKILFRLSKQEKTSLNHIDIIAIITAH